MKLLTTALLSASAMALMASGASAQSTYQSYEECVSDRQGRQVAGALIGGILGAVIGSEIADENIDNRRDRHAHRGRHHRLGGYHHRRRNHRDANDDDAATVAGAGVGALIGAGIASGDDCENLRYRDNRYNDRYDDRRYNDRYDDRYSGKPDDRYQDSYYDDGYSSDDYGYTDGSDSYSSGELLGGAQPSQNARTYNASSGYSSGASYNSADWVCEYQTTRRRGSDGYVGEVQVYMCQGNDGIWRPYDTIVGN